METINEIETNEMVKITLACGRAMSSTSNYAGDGCGGCEDNTSNQTQATCC